MVAAPIGRSLVGLTAVALLLLSLSGCNTAEGFGEDVEATGGAISDTADDVKDDLTK
jgi:predicted small secreted protein